MAALEPNYIENLRNTNSNFVIISVHGVLTHLFMKYGKVSAEYVVDIDQKVTTLQYDVSDPLVTVYNEIEELARLATAASNPYTNM